MHRNQRRQTVRWLLAAAIAAPAMSLFTSAAEAQFLIPQDGGARDANNQVGSYGKNFGGRGGAPNTAVIITPNQITYGNVTGGKEFRAPGNVDARAFRGDSASLNSDRFIRVSSSGYDPAGMSAIYQSRPFYGDSRNVAAPVGYQSPVAKFGTGQSTTVTTSQPLNGASYSSLNTGESIIPKIGTTTTIIGGPANPTTGDRSSFIVATPLSGVRAVTPDQVDNYAPRGPNPPNGNTTGDRFRTDGSGNSADAPGMAPGEKPGSLQNGPGSEGPGGNAQPGSAQPGSAQPVKAGGPGKPLGAPADAPGDSSLKSGQPLNAPLQGGQPMGSQGLGTGQSQRRQLTTPGQQSTQYTELERRFREASGAADAPKTDQQLQQDYRNARPAAPAGGVTPPAPAPVVPGTPAPGTPGAPAVPGGPAVPALPTTPPTTPLPAPAAGTPLVITSLADGVQSPTLAKSLRDAETDMKAGKFASALDKYAAAEAEAPNNPLISLGRANAELGGSSYRTAETRLRHAFAGDQALLMGRYDLRTLIGTERVDLLTKDLQDLSTKESKDPMPPFLLAYISYNTGNPAAASIHLAEVQRRQGGGEDPVVSAMIKHWKLPAVPGLNK